MEPSQQQERIALIPSTLQELEDMLELCCYNRPRLPRQVLSRAGCTHVVAWMFLIVCC